MAYDNQKTATFPVYHVKSAGTTVDVVDNEASGTAALRGLTKPAELWMIHANGKANLIKYTS